MQELFCLCQTPWDKESRRFMIQCDACESWFHGDCLEPQISPNESSLYETYHCKNCIPMHGESVMLEKRPKRERLASRKYIGDTVIDEFRYTKLLDTKDILPASFPHLKGDQLTIDYINRNGLEFPIIIEEMVGLGMRMPDSTLTVRDVADLCGKKRIVDVLEVSTQSERQMTLDEWANYFSQPEEDRERILNVITLEIGGTKLAEQVQRPNIVEQIDWIETVWPKALKPIEYPRVQLYCLMSVADSYTDFHIDFGGSSVFYHILSGSKIFYFIKPTKANLKKYEKWVMSENQGSVFFGDIVGPACQKVSLVAGNTMIIPTGWIHAVFTPLDSIVIGGNFLHGYDVAGQLIINEIETRTRVPQKYRFPWYTRMQWYACKHYFTRLRDYPESLTLYELDGMAHLYYFLDCQLLSLNDPSKTPQERMNARTDTVPIKFKNIQQLHSQFGKYWCIETQRRRKAELGVLYLRDYSAKMLYEMLDIYGIKLKRKEIIYDFKEHVSDVDYDSDLTDLEFFDEMDNNQPTFLEYDSEEEKDDDMNPYSIVLDPRDEEFSIDHDSGMSNERKKVKLFSDATNIAVKPKQLNPKSLLKPIDDKPVKPKQVIASGTVFDRLKKKMQRFKR